MRRFIGLSMALALVLAALTAVPASAASGQPSGQGANACHLLAGAYLNEYPGNVVFTSKINVGNPATVRLAGDCAGDPIATIDDDLRLDVSRPNGWSASNEWDIAVCQQSNSGLAAQDVTDLFQSGTHTVTLTVLDTCGVETALYGPVYLIVEQQA